MPAAEDAEGIFEVAAPYELEVVEGKLAAAAPPPTPG